METGIIKLNTIADCNKYFSTTTLHPLVCLIDISDTDCHAVLQSESYTVLFKEHSYLSGFGKKDCDFSDGTLAFISPGQPINISVWTGNKNDKCLLLGFHPTLIGETWFGEHFDAYTFFRYRQNEALHISCREKVIIRACMQSISEELCWGIDEYSQSLLINRIELLLNCCTRFYKRQFVTRHDANILMINKINQLLENYFLTKRGNFHGLPDTVYFSRMLGTSSAYFEDLLKHETGKDVNEFVCFKRIDIAREQLRRTNKSATCIAEELGFSSVQNFNKLFKRLSGYSPSEYRMIN